MSRQLTPVTEINQNIRRRWTAAVQILECHHVLHARNGSDYKRILMTDSQGLKFTALVFSDDLDQYRKIFKQYRRYHISNATVVPNDAKYALSSYGFSWILNKRTLVEECFDRVPVNLPCTFDFTEFGKLHEHAESESLQNVRGIVICCLASHEQGQGPGLVSRRDVVIINEEKIPLVVTLWNQFNEHEGYMLQSIQGPPALIFGLRLKVTTFNSISLTTTSTSTFLINPPVSEELQLHSWYKNNRSEIQVLLSTTNYRKNGLLLSCPTNDNIIPISTAIERFHSVKTAWIAGKLTLPVQDRQISYTACANCSKALEADTTWIVTGPSCRAVSEVQEMLRLIVLISDGTGSLKANLNTPEVEKFIPFSAKDVNICAENGENLCDSIASAIKGVTIVAFIRAYEVFYQGTSSMRFNIIKSYKPAEMVSQVYGARSLLGESEVSLAAKTTLSIPICKSGPSVSICDEGDDVLEVGDQRPAKKAKGKEVGAC